MNEHGEHQVEAETNLRPQDRFSNPKGYDLLDQDDTYYCKFVVPAPDRPGIYHIWVDGSLVYTGRAQSLRHRLSVQYGTVSPRHPYKGGQLQKCRTNAKINTAICSGQTVVFTWETCDDYVEKEKHLLADPSLRPPWNIRG